MFDLDEVAVCLVRVVLETWKALDVLLGGKMALVPLDRLRDNLSTTRPGHWFGRDPENQTFAAMLQEGAGLVVRGLVREDGQVDDAALGRFKESFGRIRDAMVLLVYALCGPPGRCTEYSVLLLKNNNLGLRAVTVAGGSVMIKFAWNKTEAMSHKARNVFRVLPWPVGQLLCCYLVARRAALSVFELEQAAVTPSSASNVTRHAALFPTWRAGTRTASCG